MFILIWGWDFIELVGGAGEFLRKSFFSRLVFWSLTVKNYVWFFFKSSSLKILLIFVDFWLMIKFYRSF